jgi:hypothetical protein
MFDRFLSTYRMAGRTDGSTPQPPSSLGQIRGFSEFMDQFAGCTFADGLYRVHTAETSQTLQQLVVEEFPSYRERITCFSYDWLGRQFALDAARREGDEPLVLMLEADTGEAMEIPATFGEFHNTEIIEYADSALATQLFAEWRQRNPDSKPLAYDECAGFQVPLFLGGSDTVDNLAVTNLQVYWSICAQLWRGTLKLPPGATIHEVRIE